MKERLVDSVDLDIIIEALEVAMNFEVTDEYKFSQLYLSLTETTVLKQEQANEIIEMLRTEYDMYINNEVALKVLDNEDYNSESDNCEIYEMAEELIDEDVNELLKAYVVKNGGATTFNGEIIEPTSGYVIGIENNVVPFDEMVNFEDTNGLLGYWLDKETNELYIDRVVIHPDKSVAMAIARTFKQKAIYNFETKKEVKVESLKSIINEGNKEA